MEVVVQIDAFLDHGKSKDVERLETRDFPKPREKQECIAQHHCFYAEMRVCMEMNGVGDAWRYNAIKQSRHATVVVHTWPPDQGALWSFA